MIAALFLQLAATAQSPPIAYQGFPEQDALSYDISLSFDFEAKEVAATADLHFRFDQASSELKLHSIAGDNWQVDFAYQHKHPISSRREGEILILDLGREFKAGEEVLIEATMRGNPPDGLYFEKNRYGEPIIFTDHFSSRARGWLPCEDHPSDRASFAVTLETDEEWEIIASGAQGESVHKWQTETDLPTYMLAFAAGPYSRVAEKGDDRFIPHFIYRKDKPKARMGLKHHAGWMQRMETTFGPYAWEKYCVVQVPTRWGGMENAGNTWVMERLFDGRDRGVGTLAHEFVHMWFGNAAGYLEWHDAWLSEGFATYFGPWLHADSGGPPLASAMASSRRRWLKASSAFTRPIRWFGFDKPDDFFSSSAPNTYQKAAWVLHMLRVELGDETFFKGIADYYQLVSPSGTKTSIFQTAMEQAAGRELGWFFDQWLNRSGCPEISVKWGADSAVITQHQEQVFRFPLKLSWKDDSGEQQERVLQIHESVTAVDLGSTVSTPVIDPDTELLWSKPRRN